MTFLNAAYDAMPASLNEGERVSCMDQCLKVAIDGRFQFDKQDAEKLKRLGITTSAGVFRPLSESFYTQACLAGGTYARMWEVEHGVKPWVADEVFDARRRGHPDVLKNNRVAPGLCVLIPGAIDQDELTLPRMEGKQVWWCTSMKDNEMVLCRYRLSENGGSPLECAGTPVRKWKVSREEWSALRARHAVEASEVKAPVANNAAKAMSP
jgi:hypothetical protein